MTDIRAADVCFDNKCESKYGDAGTVQKALEQLCNLQASGGGCAVTVGQGGQYGRLDEAIDALLKNDYHDLCIYLLPGDHDLSKGLTIKAPVRSLKIVGCGAGSRLLPGTVLVFSGLRAVQLRDFKIRFADNGKAAIDIDDCANVEIELVEVVGVPESGDALVKIRSAQKIRLNDNDFQAYESNSLNNAASVFKGHEELGKVFEHKDAGEFRRTADTVAEVLTKETASARKELAAGLNKQIEAMTQVSAGEKKSYEKFTTTLSLPANRLTPNLLAEALLNVRAVALRESPATAIAVMDAYADTMLVGNAVPVLSVFTVCRANSGSAGRTSITC